MSAASKYRLGVDVGGTFTDLVLANDATGELMSEKVLTTSSDPWEGVRTGMFAFRRRGVEPSAISTVVHGTTLVINALIERSGATVGLLTTRGFRDVLYFGRELRYDIYDSAMTLPEPIVPRRLRRDIDERVGGDGAIVQPLDCTGATKIIRELLADGVDSFAVCLLHSYLRPEHELLVRELVRQAAPELPVSLSHEVLPQLGEYERCCATTINAYVQPLAQQYLVNFVAGLREMGCLGTLYLMTSSGGTMTPDTAMAFPIHLAESGPAAGTLIAGQLGAAASLDHLLAFDMGGTTAKSCLIKGGKPLISKTYEVARIRRYGKGSGLPLGIPVIDLLEIGAGGGSIAEVDGMGLLAVGPHSAGADPGPACYGRGGKDATVTDANVILGLIRPEAFLGGSMPLERPLAEQAIRERVAGPLGIDVEAAAVAIHRIVTENMAEAARVHSVEMNVDIRGMGMVAFGGAGPIHAYGIAERLGLSRVICPRQAGVLSACGLLNAPRAFEFARSFACDLLELDFEHVNGLLGSLRQEAESLLAKSGATQPSFAFSVDMCYSGQRYEVTTPLLDPTLTQAGIHLLKESFDATYEEAYGRRLDNLPARCITWRVLASEAPPTSVVERQVSADGDEPGIVPSHERTIILPGHTVVNCAVYLGSTLWPAARVIGPAIIEEMATTIVIPPGWGGEVDVWGNVVITRLDAVEDCRSGA